MDFAALHLDYLTVVDWTLHPYPTLNNRFLNLLLLYYRL